MSSAGVSTRASKRARNSGPVAAAVEPAACEEQYADDLFSALPDELLVDVMRALANSIKDMGRTVRATEQLYAGVHFCQRTSALPLHLTERTRRHACPGVGDAYHPSRCAPPAGDGATS